MKPSEATARSMRKQFTAMPSACELAGRVDRELLEADLGDAVGHQPGIGSRAATDETLRMRPPPAACRCGHGRRGRRRAGRVRLIAIMSSWRRSGMSRSPTNVTAALLTRMSRRPKCSTVRGHHRLDLVGLGQVGGHRDGLAPARRLDAAHGLVERSRRALRAGVGVERAAQATLAARARPGRRRWRRPRLGSRR